MEKLSLIKMWVLPETLKRFKVRAAREDKTIYKIADEASLK